VRGAGWLIVAGLLSGCHAFDALSSQYGADLSCAGCADLSAHELDANQVGDGGAIDLAQVLGELAGASELTPASVDLTAEGMRDWVHWGHQSPDGVDRNAAVTPLVSGLSLLGNVQLQGYGNNLVAFSWTNGTPNAQVTTTAGVFVVGVGRGFSVTVPANTTVQTVKLYVGGYQSRGQVRAHLSDSSVSDYIDATFSRSDGSLYNATYTFTFKAASPNQTLILQWQALSLSQTDGNVTLQAVALK